ncbi:MAG: OprO/OprP family phosphate-selective porin [Candidatus Scalindua sp.]|nr:OprO/OprP family phosphate-selective porin [Candidatus Scalindua sp.]
MSIPNLIFIFLFVVYSLFSGIHTVSAQSVSVPDLAYLHLCENTVTESVPQRLIEIDNNQLPFQEEERERISLEMGKENPAGKEIQENLPPLSAQNLRIGYNNGLYLETADNRFSLKASVRLQLRYEIDDFEDQDDTSAFTIRRGRIALKGNALGDLFSYFFQLDAHSTGKQSEISTLQLIDYYTDIKVIPFAIIRLGQGRVPSNRQWLTPDSKLQMVDFSVASSEFNLGRQLGVMAHDEFFNKKLEYNLGIYTGYYDLFDGDYQDNNEWLGILRVSYNPFGPFGYSESDVEFSESPLLHISGSASFNSKEDVSFNLKKRGKVTSDNVESVMFVQEAGFKYRGFSVLEEFYLRRRSFMEERITDLGWFVQGGYFVKPEKVELTLRYSQIFFDNDRTDESTDEGTLGVNYFFSGHNYKVQFNAVRLHSDTVNDESTDYKFILQFQFKL